MSEIDFLTTRTTEWSLRMPSSTQWTDRGDVFHVDFDENEKLPLDLLATIGQTSLVGVVEKRRCTIDGRLVAVKKMDTHRNKTTNSKLNKEVEILRSLKHYHSVRILGSYTQGDSFSIVMEPVATCDLNTYLSEPASLAAEKIEACCGPRDLFLPRIMGCLAHGLQYLHKEPRGRHKNDEEKMVRHKDITPANILLDGSRVLYADFGLSDFFTATQTGSSGPSRKTRMYTSPERAADEHRNSSDDIFSLACVFAEIFNVYKGKTMEEFRLHRVNADPEKEGFFHKAEVMSAVLEWLDDLATERCDVQVIRLLRTMFNSRPAHRPNAEQVWKTLTTCTKNEHFSTIYFCGPCCMPLLHEDPLLREDPDVDPSQTKYVSSLPLPIATPVSRDLFFTTKYDRGSRLDVSWKRNLRHWNRSTLDVVQDGKHPHLLARKRIMSSGDDEGSSIAKNEAEILRKVKHRHVVTLHGTHRRGDVITLLFEPAADHDLRSYLELAELYSNQKSKPPVDLDFMTRSFGCLANALACVHAAGYEHGDIRPENILVHNRRIYLSKFSFGSKSDVGKKDSEPSYQKLHRLMDLSIGKLSLGRREESQTAAGTERQQRQQPGPYQPPEWQPTSVGQPAADIFALGCVFIEIYTVLCGRRVRDFEEFRADNEGNVAFYLTLEKTLTWLSIMKNKEHENQERFQGVIRSMIDVDASKRPKASDVAHIMRECKTSSGLVFSGDCHDYI